MSKDLINYYLQSLKTDNAIYLASQYGIIFTSEEMDTVLPLLKKNWEAYLIPNGKECMLRDIETLTSKETMVKADKLLNFLLNNFR